MQNTLKMPFKQIIIRPKWQNWSLFVLPILHKRGQKVTIKLYLMNVLYWLILYSRYIWKISIEFLCTTYVLVLSI